MSIAIRTILAAVESHAAATGRFDRVISFEPRQPPSYEPRVNPGFGLSFAAWPGEIAPYPGASGQNVTSVRLTVVSRIYRARTSDPLDLIDVEMVEAIDDLWAAYSADFTLGGLIMAVDLLGMSGSPMRGRAGYLEEDEQVFRTFDIEVPLVLADVYPQQA